MTARLFLLLSASPLLALTGCSKHPAAAPDTATASPSAKVQVAVARLETVPALTDVSASIRPLRRAQISAKVMGPIETVGVTLGQAVKTGDLLVKIGAGEITARVAQAQAQLNVARRDLTRERDLLGRGASTADLVRSLEDRLALNEAMLREAEVMLGYATIRAPFAGVVARKPAEAGDLAAPGQLLLELESADAFQVEAAVPDSLAGALSSGASLAVEIPATGTHFNATVAELSSAADAAARSVLARLTVPPGPTVRSGQFARVLVPGQPVGILLVPRSAVARLGQMERSFVVGENNRAQLRLVKTGAVRGDRIEILSGLADGERVVLAPAAGLREGQTLELLP